MYSQHVVPDGKAAGLAIVQKTWNLGCLQIFHFRHTPFQVQWDSSPGESSPARVIPWFPQRKCVENPTWYTFVSWIYIPSIRPHNVSRAEDISAAGRVSRHRTPVLLSYRLLDFVGECDDFRLS